MPLNFAMSVMSAAEFLLWALLGYLFWTKNLHHRFPAMNVYLILRVCSAPLLLLLLYGQAQLCFHDYCFVAYFLAYWSVYIASAVILFFVAMELFKAALSGFSGLMKFGVVVFRWAAVVSVILRFTTMTFTRAGHFDPLSITMVAYRLMRSVSILEICLLAFMCLSMNALNLSVRDLPFGVALGFGMLSSNDFIFGSLMSRYTTLINPI